MVRYSENYSKSRKEVAIAVVGLAKVVAAERTLGVAKINNFSVVQAQPG
jgi:hypothetical protein